MPNPDDRRLWPGTVPPRAGSPLRRPGSVRRTTNVDLLRPEGFGGPLLIAGIGRDLATSMDGRSDRETDLGAVDPQATVVAEERIRVVVDYAADRAVTEVATHPEVDGLHRLLGIRAGSGFRRSLAELLPELAAGHTIVHQLLDDVPPGTLISGSSLARSGLIHLATGSSPAARAPVDICAGWQQGGAMFDAIAQTGIPLLGWGPPAPGLDLVEDPHAWHPMGDLPPSSMRRRRLIDVSRGVAGGLDVQIRFRDSYWEDDGTETVVHEYAVGIGVDDQTWTITAVEVVPGPLPAPECPSAAASGQRLVGEPLSTLRAVVRDTFTGTTTCTHLNDAFRSLADVEHLWETSMADPPEPSVP